MKENVLKNFHDILLNATFTNLKFLTCLQRGKLLNTSYIDPLAFCFQKRIFCALYAFLIKTKNEWSVLYLHYIST